MLLMLGQRVRYLSKPQGGVRGGRGPVSTELLACVGRNAREISRVQVWLGPRPVAAEMLTLGVTYRTWPSINQILIIYICV